MNRFQWKWIFTGSKTCCNIWRPFWFAMVAILNQKWSPKYKNPPIWTKFGFQHDRVKNWALIITCYVLTLFFIHTTSTCIVRLGDICNALRYSNQYFHNEVTIGCCQMLVYCQKIKNIKRYNKHTCIMLIKLAAVMNYLLIKNKVFIFLFSVIVMYSTNSISQTIII